MLYGTYQPGGLTVRPAADDQLPGLPPSTPLWVAMAARTSATAPPPTPGPVVPRCVCLSRASCQLTVSP